MMGYGKDGPSAFIGHSSRLADVERFVDIAAASDASVLITGETGTGKEVAAREIHRRSRRASAPFVACNCAAIPLTLLESELFGHERGAFTGAATVRVGRFETAADGIVFLDEIGELPLEMQVKLLRVLQERTFERLGSTQTRTIRARIVAATNRDLAQEVREGRFRADLYYRLNVLRVPMPPLREHPEDVSLLWEHFLSLAAARDHVQVPQTSPATLRLLRSHTWPGNVRELENLASHAVAMSAGATIEPKSLLGFISAESPVVIDRRSSSISLPGMSLADLEREAIVRTYEQTQSVTETAAALGVSVRKIQYRLSDYRREGSLGSETAGADAAPGALPPPARPQLLLAEDDDEVRWALAALLEDEGFDVVSVPSGRALLEHLGQAFLNGENNTQPDVIITDIRMPGMNGLELLRGARQKGWNVPVIVISAYGDTETRATAKELGATAFLDKPIDYRRLTRILAQTKTPAAN